MNRPALNHEALLRALKLRDLTDPGHGPHAMQILVAELHGALAARWGCARRIERGSPVVTVADNYDHLGYPPDGASREARYTRYLCDRLMLRSQMSAVIPATLRSLAHDPPDDLLLVCPGLVYRRDAIDRLHVGEPHQLDLWRVTSRPLATDDLHDMIATVVASALPGVDYRTLPAIHPYTHDGLQIDVRTGGEWVEIGECGLAAAPVLRSAGLSRASGLAMGLGLDRLLMLRKGIDDIRLLRDEDPRVQTQMQDLSPWKPVSDQPAIARDLSLAVAADLGEEEIGDRIREAMGVETEWIESVEIVTETPWSELPRQARLRMGMRPGQKNVLLRLTLRHPVRTLVSAEANRLRDRVHATVHEGARHEWACGP
jgi:phenylalanyl-tRNA synthetase alpha chain